MTKLRLRIERAARAPDSTVLIEGKSGTGKDVVARLIHRDSRRAGGPFVAINCAALPEGLVESELFGHAKGAFTGADYDRKGKFELAAGGTIFLDEIGELPLTTQAKLLRVLQEHEVDKIGGKGPLPVDVRVIAATNRELALLVSEGEFRADLYFRLKVGRLRTPPLRERREDIPLLIQYFFAMVGETIERYVGGIDAEALQVLQNHDWPGNVRDLRNAIEYAMVYGNSDVVRAEDLPEELFERPDLGYGDAIVETRRRLIENALSLSGGDYKSAAALLRIHPHSIHKILKNHKLIHLRHPPQR